MKGTVVFVSILLFITILLDQYFRLNWMCTLNGLVMAGTSILTYLLYVTIESKRNSVKNEKDLETLKEQNEEKLKAKKLRYKQELIEKMRKAAEELRLQQERIKAEQRAQAERMAREAQKQQTQDESKSVMKWIKQKINCSKREKKVASIELQNESEIEQNQNAMDTCEIASTSKAIRQDAIDSNALDTNTPKHNGTPI